MSSNTHSLPLIGTIVTKMRALKEYTGWSSQVQRATAEKLGVERRGALHLHPSRRSANRGNQHSPLPVEGELLQPPSCCPPQAGAPPSNSATTHSVQIGLWRLSLLVIIPWERTCFLFQGRQSLGKESSYIQATPGTRLLLQITSGTYSYRRILTNTPHLYSNSTTLGQKLERGGNQSFLIL